MIDAVRRLREKTSAGIMDCKVALKEANGEIEKAIEILRKKGKATASKKSSRTTKEGSIVSYIHMNHKIGVLLELNCETDFVARNDEYKKLGKDLSMQIAASRPIFVKKEDVPESLIKKEKEVLEEQIASKEKDKKKPKEVLDKILEGKLDKFFEDVCLWEQPFIKDPKTKIKDLVEQQVATLGENINIRRFVRYELGEEL